ncbi:alpha/beta hydrolase family protein [Prevotella sp. 10(H)]|uniref:alpha/beta hydrolase n=1 Tax=Prevotella sp. 10(H) TaxID=1158294 RepID=UPI0004A6D607|nr:alpha/beta hydrolase-fold protein [Prevotella sp. 10(H)]
MKKLFTTLCLLCIIVCTPLFSQTVDTVEVFSSKMNKTIKNVVVLPENYNKSDTQKYPVLYLLHGHGGKFDEWVLRTKKSLPQDATRWQMIIVCPDGQNSWYWDSPVDPASQFDTYISKELVKYIDNKYRTIVSPQGRGITGFSMGGHGGLWLGINHPDVFGACGGMSGGVDLRAFPGSFEIVPKIGKRYKDDAGLWDEHTILNQLHKIEPNTLKIIIDCGINDFFYNVNKRLHEEMIYMNIPHDYIERPGEHSAEYLHNSIDYQMMFFYKLFNAHK